MFLNSERFCKTCDKVTIFIKYKYLPHSVCACCHNTRCRKPTKAEYKVYHETMELE